MIRLLTAAAVAALFAAPVLAQTSPSDPSTSDPSTSSPSWQTSPPGSGSMESLPESQSQVPFDCTANDPRPECQTATLPPDATGQDRESGSMSTVPEPSPGSSTLDGQRSLDPGYPSGSPPSTTEPTR